MKTAVITGANRGIGKGIVKKFSENKWNIYACSRVEDDAFKEELADFEATYGARITPIYFDLKDKETMKRAVKAIVKDSANIDVLVNNAGVSSTTLFMMTSMEEMKDIFDINLFAPLYFTRLIARYMLKNKKGAIINIASVSGMMNTNGGLTYGMSKAALLYATKTLAIELGGYGIRVNSVSPGFINTDMWRSRSQELFNKILERTPLKKQGSTDDVAEAVLFLADDKASHITGANIVVDGGGYLRGYNNA